MRVAWLYPGQAAQEPGMLARLPASPAAQATLAEASEALGRDVRALDTAEALAGTAATQLALLIAGVATARALAAEGIGPDVVAGHSVGAFAAAVTADVLALGDAVRAVALRGALMAAAYPHGYGMAAVIGLPERRLVPLVDEARRAGPLHLANRNAPLQTVAAGAVPALEAFCAAARRAGAVRAERLSVAVPSHCPLLEPVARELAAALAGIAFQPPRLAYASSCRARLLADPRLIRDDLATNVAAPVRWHDTTVMLHERGVRLFAQMLPGTVLADLAAAAFPDARCLALATSGLESVAHVARGLRAGTDRMA
jgi:malonate decarboxylase epsilon subunit